MAAAGGVALVALYSAAGGMYSGLGTDTINGVLAGTTTVLSGAFLIKIVATSITLETGGSGGIVTPIFFVGATSGAALAPLFGISPPLLAAYRLRRGARCGSQHPLPPSVMAIEILPASDGVYAALAAVTAFLMVGHRSVYASQKLGLSKSAGLEIELHVPIGDVDRSLLSASARAASPNACTTSSKDPTSKSTTTRPAEAKRLANFCRNK